MTEPNIYKPIIDLMEDLRKRGLLDNIQFRLPDLRNKPEIQRIIQEQLEKEKLNGQ